MKLLFMGTPDFAVPCLEKLAASHHEVAAVFSQPDKPKGRGYALCPSPVKECALRHGIPVYQPVTLRDGTALEVAKKLDCDLIVVVAYGKILPKELLQSAPFGCINVHGSLLPKYRGAAPIQRAVLDGESETGITIIQMGEGIDTGDMLLKKTTKIDQNETADALFERLSVLGAQALLESLDLMEQNKIVPVSQDDTQATYAKMIDKSMCPIDWSRSALELHNQVRGLAVWPVATTTLHGAVLKVHSACLCELPTQQAPATVLIANKRLCIACGNQQALELLEVQLEGKKKMCTSAFLLGHSITVGEQLGGKI